MLLKSMEINTGVLSRRRGEPGASQEQPGAARSSQAPMYTSKCFEIALDTVGFKAEGFNNTGMSGNG